MQKLGEHALITPVPVTVLATTFVADSDGVWVNVPAGETYSVTRWTRRLLDSPSAFAHVAAAKIAKQPSRARAIAIRRERVTEQVGGRCLQTDKRRYSNKRHCSCNEHTTRQLHTLHTVATVLENSLVFKPVESN